MTELTTNVDQLMELVEQRKKISVSDAAKALNTKQKLVQSWVDFLVEERILGIEYKFTTPYIYVNSKERLQAAKEEEQEVFTLSEFKNAFFEHAKDKGMPPKKLEQLWKQHLAYVIDGQKQYFANECQRRDVNDAENHFEQYKDEVLNGTE